MPDGPSNIHLVRGSYEAFARGDLDGALAPFAADVEWHQAQGLPHGGVYHGLAEVRRHVFDPLDRDWWAEFSADPDELLDAGVEVVVVGHYRGLARETGKSLDVPFVHIWTMRGGTCVRFRQFLDTAGWIDALTP